MPEPMSQTLGQKRASHAWQAVKAIKAAVTAGGEPDDGLRKKYRTEARQLTSLIQANGLGLTLSYYRSKSSDAAFGKLYDHLAEWLKDQVAWPNTDPDLLGCITASDSRVYLHATQEALALAIWLRRFAEALLPEDEE